LIEGQNSAEFDLFVNGKELSIKINRQGDQVKNIQFNGKSYPSLVLPEQLSKVEKIEFELGNPDAPYLFHTNSMLTSCQYFRDNKRMNLKLKAFTSHENKSIILSPWQPKEIILNNDAIIEKWDTKEKNGVYYIEFQLKHQSAEDMVKIQF